VTGQIPNDHAVVNDAETIWSPALFVGNNRDRRRDIDLFVRFRSFAWRALLHRRRRKLRHWISATMAALGVGLMFALWSVTIHLPPVLNFFRIPGATQGPDKWSDVFIGVAFWGGFWALLRDRKDLSLGADSNRA
jgi:hypothetical protein